MDIVYLLGAILFGAIGTLAIFGAADPNAPWWLSWVSWFVFTPAFYCLFYAFETFGVARAFALWSAGIGLIVVIQAVRWGDKLSMFQWVGITLTLAGLAWFGLG